MSTPYTGVSASLASGVTITIPSDGDPDNAATFNVAFQRLADYIANLAGVGRGRSGAIVKLVWTASAQTGTFAGTNQIVTLAPTGTNSIAATFGSDVTATAAPHRLTANTNGLYRIWLARWLTNSGTNTATLTVQKNGGAAPIGEADLGQVNNTTLSSPVYAVVAETYLSLVATDFVQLGFYGTSGGAYNLTPASVGGISPQWFGMEKVA